MIEYFQISNRIRSSLANRLLMVHFKTPRENRARLMLHIVNMTRMNEAKFSIEA